MIVNLLFMFIELKNRGVSRFSVAFIFVFVGLVVWIKFGFVKYSCSNYFKFRRVWRFVYLEKCYKLIGGLNSLGVGGFI